MGMRRGEGGGGLGASGRFRGKGLAWVLGFVLAVAVTSVGTAVARAEDAGAPPAKPPAPSPNDGCLACHTDPAKAGKHLVDPKAHASSVHGKKDCTECHFDFETAPHSKEAKTVGCAECHDKEAADVLASSHKAAGVVPADGAPPPPADRHAPSCVACHGAPHEIKKASDPTSRLYPLNVPLTCGSCHFAPDARGDVEVAKVMSERYTDDTHSRGLLKSGLVVTATCVTCHGGHKVVSVKDVTSPVHPDNVSATCGACHAGILRQYKQSIHGMTARHATDKNAVGKEPATCTTCHKPHHIRDPLTEADFKRQVMDTCGECHADKLGSYRNTYHGRVSDLGGAGVASCTDCHTAHEILPASDPKSSVHHPGLRTKTCAVCHEGATDAFATYAVHANPDDKEKWPILYWARTIMTTMIVVVWCLAGLHILLWFFRAMREPKPDHSHLTGRWYQRWPPFYRILHMIVASTFLLLALTGMPLRFHDTSWGQALYGLLGGPASVRFLHRLGGAVTFAYFAVYLVHLTRRVLRGEKGLFKGPHTMLPRWKDVQDVRANFRWFFKGGQRPNFDRWTYWEKFDFWAEVWGVGFIGLTGLIMWFPIASTSVLPGWTVNLAHILHSYEALLATGFIFSVHFFHANLRPGKFPLDPIIFTGRIPEEELQLERPAEYARMKADGRLEREALPAPDPALVRRAYIVGGTLLSIALALLFLMMYGLVT